MEDIVWGKILLFYTVILVGIAMVSVHYRKKYEELRANPPKRTVLNKVKRKRKRRA